MGKAIGYCRVSTEEQGISLQLQKNKIIEYCKLYEIDLVDVVSDIGTGKNLERDGIKNIIKMMENKEIDTVVIYKLDRLVRNVSILCGLVEKYFRKNCNLLSVQDNINTKTANGRLHLNIVMSMAQYELEVIGERTSQALQSLKAKGQKLGNPRLKRFGANEAEQAVLNMLRQNAHLGVTAMAAALNDAGHVTRRLTPFSPQNVAALRSCLRSEP